MKIAYYSKEKEELYEFESELISKINEKKQGLIFDANFEFSITKKSSSLLVFKSDSKYHTVFAEFSEDQEERIGIKIDDLETLHQFIDNFINESDSKVTRNYFENFNIRKKEKEEKKYLEWKRGYKRKIKKEKYNFLKPIILTVSIVAIIVLSYNLWKSDEYKFIFRKTTTIKAEITETKIMNFYKGYSYQRITYEYKFKGKNYKDYETIGRKIGLRSVGQTLKLKVATNNPEINKIITYYSD